MAVLTDEFAARAECAFATIGHAQQRFAVRAGLAPKPIRAQSIRNANPRQKPATRDKKATVSNIGHISLTPASHHGD